MIAMILYEDELYKDLLSERVILQKYDDPPPYMEDALKDLNHVSPMKSLVTLRASHQHYSYDNVNLSRIIIEMSLTCLMHKRVAVHLALIIGLIQNNDGRAKFKMRAQVFTYAIPFYIDMLASIDGNYDKLLSLYYLVHGMWSSPTVEEDAECEGNINKLKVELNSLIDDIKSSCVVQEMKQYCSSLDLDNLKSCEDKITDENIISNLDVNNYIEILMENENAILNMYDEMDLFRTLDMSAWNALLKTPHLTPVVNAGEFIRKPLLKYRDEVEYIITTMKSDIGDKNASAQVEDQGNNDILVEK